MRAVVAREGLDEEIEIDSAGTGYWHVGDPPDPRSTAAARERGIVMEGAARQVTAADFEAYDLLLAADAQNVAALRALAPDEEAAAKVVPAARVRPGVGRRRRPRRAGPLLRRRRRLRPRARPRRGGLRRAAGAPARGGPRPRAVMREALAAALGDAVVALDPIPGGDLNAAYRATLAGGARVFVKTSPDAAPGAYASEAAGLAWLAAVEAASRCPRCSRWTSAGSRWRGSTAAGARTPRRSAAAWPRCTARAPGGRARCRPAPAALRPRPARPAQRAARGLAGLLRGARLAAARADGRRPRRAGRRRRPRGRGGRPRRSTRSPARTSRSRACTATSGAATSIAGADGRPWLIDPAAYGGHREVDLAMLELFGSPALGSARPTTRSGRGPRATPSGSRSTSCCRCWSTPCCSAAAMAHRHGERQSGTPETGTVPAMGNITGSERVEIDAPIQRVLRHRGQYREGDGVAGVAEGRRGPRARRRRPGEARRDRQRRQGQDGQGAAAVHLRRADLDPLASGEGRRQVARRLVDAGGPRRRSHPRDLRARRRSRPHARHAASAARSRARSATSSSAMPPTA